MKDNFYPHDLCYFVMQKYRQLLDIFNPIK